ncbi:MAG: DOMON domain-containing protein, partial [Planctomycetota bacterium]
MAEPEKTEGEEEDAHAPDEAEEADGDAPEAEPAPQGSGELAPQAPAPEEGGGPPPVAVSVFVVDPEGLPATLASPFWGALPRVDELLPLEGCAPVRPATELRVAHDARHLACHVLCKEPNMDLVRTRRTGEVGRLDLDDSVEILLDPYRHGFAWSLRATPSGEWETIVPVGAVARPECIVEVRRAEKSWEV